MYWFALPFEIFPMRMVDAATQQSNIISLNKACHIGNWMLFCSIRYFYIVIILGNYGEIKISC